MNERLTLHDLSLTDADCPRTVFSADRKRVELALRQYLLLRCGGVRLNAAILEALGGSNGRAVSAMPATWISVLRELGIPVASGRSRFRFARFVATRFTIGLAQVAVTLVKCRKAGEPHGGVRYAHFIDLTASHLPRESGGKSREIVSWYLEWKGRVAPLDEIRHCARGAGIRQVGTTTLRPVAATIPALHGIEARFRFLLWSIGASATALVNALLGRWTAAVLLGEAARERQVLLTPHDELASEYLFHLGSSIYRPLWTYAAERMGAVVTLYNFSASFQDFKTKELGVPPLEIGFQSMSWQRILLWSDPYSRFCRTVLKESRVELVPPIWFSDADKEIRVSSRPCIAVFDVTPVRRSRETVAVNALEYRTFPIGRDFLEDIYTVVSAMGFDLVWKRKRGYHDIHDKRYIKLADEFAQRPGVIDISPGISAFRVVEACQAVISMPFTSTAIIAAIHARPSVYYDSTGLLFPDDRGAQGILLVSGRTELAKWLHSAVAALRPH